MADWHDRPEHYAALWADDIGKPRDHPDWQAAYHENLSGLQAEAAKLPNRNLSNAQFSPMYHGSPYSIEPGAHIEAGAKPSLFGGMSRTGYTYMTPDAERAASYAKGSMYQRAKNPHLYQVEPTGEYGDDPGSSNGYRSRSPLRVVREIPMGQAGKQPSANSRNTTHGPNYIGRDSEYDSDMELFERKWYGD